MNQKYIETKDTHLTKNISGIGNQKQENDIARTKRAFLREWIKAVNNHGGFGVWHEAVSYDPNDVTRTLSGKF